MRSFLPILWVVVLAAGLSAVRADGLSDQELRDARKLYIGKCARCHKLHDPSKYSDAAWEEWMDKMSRKAKLKPEQKELLSRYVGTLRHGDVAGDPSPKPMPR